MLTWVINQEKHMDVEEIEMAYLAGAIDGDGSFSLIKRRNGSMSPLYQPMIQLCNVSRLLVDIIKDTFGGWIFERASHIAKDGKIRKVTYSWKLDKTNVGEVIPKILPYLIVKKERAAYLLSYMSQNPFKRGSMRLSTEVLSSREAAYAEMIRLNDERRWDKTIEPGKRVDSDFPVFWSYFAGLMDTDGSFSVKREKRPSCKSPVYSPCILLSMVDPKGISFVRKNCVDGTVTVIKSRSANSGICYRWAIHTRIEAISFLKKVIPYLRVKKSQAEVLLDFCLKFSEVKHRRSGVSAEEIAKREEAYQQMIHLNEHGVYKPSLIDLEAHKMGDRAEGVSRGERLSERDSKECATV
jgi:hypothetical protein